MNAHHVPYRMIRRILTRLLQDMPAENIAAVYARWIRLQEDDAKNDEPKRGKKRRHTERRLSLHWVVIGWCSFTKVVIAIWWF